MSILKDVAKAIKAVNSLLTFSNLDPKQRDLQLSKLSALNELKEYIETGAWLRADGRSRFIQVLASDFDYEQVAKECNKSPKSLKSSISIALRRLEDKIGSDIVEQILDGNIEDALRRFRVATGVIKPRELYPKETLKLLPHSQKDTILSIIDCKPEADLLAELTLRNQKTKISSLDTAKLAYLLSILESNREKDAHLKNFLLKYINGELSWDESVIKSNKISIYKEDTIFDKYFFNQLNKQIKHTRLSVADVYGNEAIQLELNKLDALLRIDDYVKSLVWLPDDSAKDQKAEVLQALFNSNYDYSKVASEQGTTLSGMEKFISRQSNVILDLIGQDTLDLIQQGNIDLALYQLTNITNGVEEVYSDVAKSSR